MSDATETERARTGQAEVDVTITTPEGVLMTLDRKIYTQWDKIVLAVTPVFRKMTPDMLRFFRDKSDYNQVLQHLAGITLKANLAAAKKRRGANPRSTKRGRPALKLVHLNVRRKDVQ